MIEAAFRQLLTETVRDLLDELVTEVRAERTAPTEHLKVADVAEALKVHPNTVYRWIADGDLPAFKLGENTRVSTEALREFVATHTTGDADALRAVS